jgi:hypothetical protein
MYTAKKGDAKHECQLSTGAKAGIGLHYYVHKSMYVIHVAGYTCAESMHLVTK